MKLQTVGDRSFPVSNSLQFHTPRFTTFKVEGDSTELPRLYLLVLVLLNVDVIDTIYIERAIKSKY